MFFCLLKTSVDKWGVATCLSIESGVKWKAVGESGEN